MKLVLFDSQPSSGWKPFTHYDHFYPHLNYNIHRHIKVSVWWQMANVVNSQILRYDGESRTYMTANKERLSLKILTFETINQ